MAWSPWLATEFVTYSASERYDAFGLGFLPLVLHK
jgi:hypothetical protein